LTISSSAATAEIAPCFAAAAIAASEAAFGATAAGVSKMSQ